MRLVIDLDDTLCTPDKLQTDTYHRYALAKPIHHRILAVRQAHAAGHYIIIHTARRMLTHNGDVAAVEADVGEVTRSWLREHNVPYHELVFGKPYGDYYIDDKAALPDFLPFAATLQP